MLKKKQNINKGDLLKKQMHEMLHQKFFMFYDYLNDGFVDFAMQFYEDPFGFDVTKAKEEAENKQDVENSIAPLVPKEDGFQGKCEYKVSLPNADLNARVEESF